MRSRPVFLPAASGIFGANKRCHLPYSVAIYRDLLVSAWRNRYSDGPEVFESHSPLQKIVSDVGCVSQAQNFYQQPVTLCMIMEVCKSACSPSVPDLIGTKWPPVAVRKLYAWLFSRFFRT